MLGVLVFEPVEGEFGGLLQAATEMAPLTRPFPTEFQEPADLSAALSA